MEQNEIEKYILFVKEHAEEAAKMVDEEFHRTKALVRKKIREIIRSFLKPLPVHYEWEMDDCPYDYSGILTKSGKIDRNQTVEEFLENEYTGTGIATYTSNYGIRYETYGDILSFEINEIADKIMCKVIADFLRKKFASVSFSEKEMDSIVFDSKEYVYEICIVWNLFFYEWAIDYYELDQIRLKDL